MTLQASSLNSYSSKRSSACSRLTILLFAFLLASTSAFSIPPSKTLPNRGQGIQAINLADVSGFYETYPLESAVLTFGFKASVADGIAQFKASQDQFSLEFRRNLGYVLYGGLFLGIVCHMEYDYLFPLLFGTEEAHVFEKVVFDNFVTAPLIWLPPVYFIKALIYDYSMKEGLQKYIDDVQQNGLLWRYWQVWIPAQSFSFSVVPDHLRPPFMAFISFFWFIIFSSVSSKSDELEEA
jgi:hypothetical protein